jgi:hypothetical protein
MRVRGTEFDALETMGGAALDNGRNIPASGEVIGDEAEVDFLICSRIEKEPGCAEGKGRADKGAMFEELSSVHDV